MLKRPSNRVFMLILSHKKSISRNRQHLILKNHPLIKKYDYYYFIGDLSLKTDYEIDDVNKIVYLKVPDNYESLSLKVYYSLKFISERYADKIIGVFKTDDDVIINLDLIDNLKRNNAFRDYFGIVNVIQEEKSSYHIGKCENEFLNKIEMNTPIGTKYCSGGGYYINSIYISQILSKIDNFNKIIYEDVAIGKTLSELKIEPYNINVKVNGFFWE